MPAQSLELAFLLAERLKHEKAQRRARAAKTRGGVACRRVRGRQRNKPKQSRQRESSVVASHVFQQVDVFTAEAFKGNPLAS